MNKEFLYPRLNESSDDEYQVWEEHLPELVEDATDRDSPQMAEEMGALNGDSDGDRSRRGRVDDARGSGIEYRLDRLRPRTRATPQVQPYFSVPPPAAGECRAHLAHRTVRAGAASYHPSFIGYQTSFADDRLPTSQVMVSPSLGNCSLPASGSSSPILPRTVQARGGKRNFVVNADVGEQVSSEKRVNATRSDLEKNRMMHSIDDAGISKRHSRARGQKHSPVPRPSRDCPCPTFVRGSDLHTLFPIPDGHHLEMNQLMCCIRGFTSFVREIDTVQRFNDFMNRPENRHMHPCIRQMEECMARSFDPLLPL